MCCCQCCLWCLEKCIKCNPAPPPTPLSTSPPASPFAAGWPPEPRRSGDAVRTFWPQGCDRTGRRRGPRLRPSSSTSSSPASSSDSSSGTSSSPGRFPWPTSRRASLHWPPPRPSSRGCGWDMSTAALFWTVILGFPAPLTYAGSCGVRWKLWWRMVTPAFRGRGGVLLFLYCDHNTMLI